MHLIYVIYIHIIHKVAVGAETYKIHKSVYIRISIYYLVEKGNEAEGNERRQ